jgi:hypothetical protein
MSAIEAQAVALLNAIDELVRVDVPGEAVLKHLREALQSASDEKLAAAQAALTLATQRLGTAQADLTRAREHSAAAEADALDAWGVVGKIQAECDAARAALADEHAGRKEAVRSWQACASEMQGKLNAMSDAWERDRTALARLEGLARAHLGCICCNPRCRTTQALRTALPPTPAEPPAPASPGAYCPCGAYLATPGPCAACALSCHACGHRRADRDRSCRLCRPWGRRWGAVRGTPVAAVEPPAPALLPVTGDSLRTGEPACDECSGFGHVYYAGAMHLCGRGCKAESPAPVAEAGPGACGFCLGCGGDCVCGGSGKGGAG